MAIVACCKVAFAKPGKKAIFIINYRVGALVKCGEENALASAKIINY